MIYAYIRVSTDKQSVENQRFEINGFCSKKRISVDSWTEETVSGLKRADKRRLGNLLGLLKPDDILIVSELSRIGRNLLQIMGILNDLMEKNVILFTVKEGYELGNNINSKVLAFAFGLSAEIERNLISQRTREALARKKAEGIKLGRPTGQASIKSYKLYKERKKVVELRRQGYSYDDIAQKFGVNRMTVSKFIQRLQDDE